MHSVHYCQTKHPYKITVIPLAPCSRRYSDSLTSVTSSINSSPLPLCCAVLCLVAQLCLTLSDPMDCSPPCSSVLGIFQARIQERLAISFSRRSSRPRNQTHISCVAGGFFTPGSPGFSVGASGKESACQCNPWKPTEGAGPHQSR